MNLELIAILVAALQTGTVANWLTAIQGIVWLLTHTKLMLVRWRRPSEELMNAVEAKVAHTPALNPTAIPPGSVIVVVPPGAHVTVTVRGG